MTKPKQATLSLPEARRIALRAQGLADDDAPFGLGKTGALRAMQHLGYVQIDTIAVVQRAHHHVLWSRVPDYRPHVVHALQEKDRAVFEYWNHAASYLPMSAYRFSLPLMRRFRRDTHWSDNSPELRRAMRRVLRRIRRDGALRLRDVESKELVQGWSSATPSKIEKRALHELWMRGDVMICSRQGFQKVFDLSERVLPPDTDKTSPTQREAAEFHVRRALRALGVARLSELHYLQDATRASAVKTALHGLIKRGNVVEVRLEGTPCYTTPEALMLKAPLRKMRLRILSPFDNLVIQRKRLQWLFGFDYFIECYVPAAKRRYGYFCLPLLYGDKFIGRMDAKADRKSRTLIIHHLFVEDEFKESTVLDLTLRNALRAFADFQDCDDFDVRKISSSSRNVLHGHRKLRSR